VIVEMENVRQRPEEGTRRWFSDDDFDLIIWYSHAGELLGFQLCYDKQGTERAFTWKTDGSFTHSRVDSGDSVLSGMKKTAVLIADGTPAPQTVADAFRSAATGLDPEIVDLVYQKVVSFPNP